MPIVDVNRIGLLQVRHPICPIRYPAYCCLAYVLFIHHTSYFL